MWAAVFAVAVVGYALGEPPSLDIPEKIKPEGGYVILTPKTNAKGVSYVGLSGVQPFPNQLLANPLTFVLPVGGLADGTYEFVVVASLNDEHARKSFVVQIGNDAKPPPSPLLPDQLQKDLRKAYQEDASPDRDEAYRKMAAFYKAAAELSRDESLRTWGDLFDRMAAKAKEHDTYIAGKLVGVQKVINGELTKALPGSGAGRLALDKAGRDVAYSTFKRVAAAIEATK